MKERIIKEFKTAIKSAAETMEQKCHHISTFEVGNGRNITVQYSQKGEESVAAVVDMVKQGQFEVYVRNTFFANGHPEIHERRLNVARFKNPEGKIVFLRDGKGDMDNIFVSDLPEEVKLALLEKMKSEQSTDKSERIAHILSLLKHEENLKPISPSRNDIDNDFLRRNR